MSYYSQPKDFRVVHIATTEISGMETEPANIVQVGDQLVLRTYFNWDGSNFFEKQAVIRACEGEGTNPPTAKVSYFLEDLECGGTPIKIPGGDLTKLIALDGQMEEDGWDAWNFDPNELVYRAETLELPTDTATEGTWQVTVVLNGGAGSRVSVFYSDMFIQLLT
jgi:hypothetical protein